MKAKTKSSKKVVSSVVGRVNHHLKMAVIPHKKNDYRPHLIRGYGLIAIAFVVIGLQLGYNMATTGSVLGRQSDITINTLFDQTNKVRMQNGEPALKLNDKLDQAAYLKAKDMIAKQYWAHNAPDGTPPWKWFGQVNYNYDEAGENLAKNFTTTSAVMTAWMNSPEHRDNILKDSYQDVGFAVVSGDLNGQPTTLIVALYGMPAESAISSIQKTFANAVPTNNSSILTQFAVAFQSISPAAIGGLIIIGFAVLVAILAHGYRRKLPKLFRQSWRRHHGLYKAAGMISLGLVMILLYGGGQI